MAIIDEPTVFILGAGFTKAFLPDAPLLTDDYGGLDLLDKFKNFDHAGRILEMELNRGESGEINIERLMTRLDRGMPYDLDRGVAEEMRLLSVEVRHQFLVKIAQAKNGEFHSADLAAFAHHCLTNRITCITLNYDDMLDEALWKANPRDSEPPEPHWHPDGGYGFFCHPSISVVSDPDRTIGDPSMFLLKLHGSLNWLPRRGFTEPYAIEAITHHEDWFEDEEGDPIRQETISLHLETDPFIVPPVLTKSALVDEPILRLVWQQAYQALRSAHHVVFVGYSLPVTDVAVSILFDEALDDIQLDNLSVVNLAENDNERRDLMDVYKSRFDTKIDGLIETQFDFRGALEWSRDLVSGNSSSDI